MPKMIYANTHTSDMFYAVGQLVPDPFFYIEADDASYVFLDHREYGVFEEHNTNDSIKLVLLNPILDMLGANTDATTTANKLAWHLCQSYGLVASPLIVPTSFPLDMADYLRSKGMTLLPTAPMYPSRLHKTSEQAGYIRDALTKTYHAYDYIEQVLRDARIVGDTIEYHGVPLTSEYLQSEVERILLSHNMLSTEGMIISCAQHAAIPHHHGAGIIRPHQTIICDIFPKDRSTGYFADMTRTYVKGTPSEYIARMHEAVQQAQEAAIAAVQPGVRMGDVHQLCVDIFLEAGFDAGDVGFIHGTGHGLGIDIHEAPYVRAGIDDVFEPGHVVTIEPGLYYTEHGGVRIEDVVWVTEDGCENLTTYHKEYIIP